MAKSIFAGCWWLVNLSIGCPMAELGSLAELNIPYYPLLRRDVDCIIALDASADSQDLWFTKAEG